MADYFVYILASRSRTLYVGVTNDLQRRLHEHRDSSRAGFTNRYRVTRLVHLESTPDVRSAIAREKQIKSWNRARKIELIESVNPTWLDLSESWPEMQSCPRSLRLPRDDRILVDTNAYASSLGMTDEIGVNWKSGNNDGRSTDARAVVA